MDAKMLADLKAAAPTIQIMRLVDTDMPEEGASGRSGYFLDGDMLHCLPSVTQMRRVIEI